jgi:hypothetical protein
VKNKNITQQRLHNQRIAGVPFGRPEEVVQWLAAVQAQDYTGAKWALGLRIREATDTAVEQAFNEGIILRTHVLRPTWHFVAPADIRWLLALTAPRVHGVNGTMYRKLELDSTILNRGSAVLVNALQGGQTLTRDELRTHLEESGIAVTDGVRLAYVIMYAELEGIVCSGPRRGKQFTYALLEERVPPASTLTREEALAELAQRFFLSRGPATVYDLAKWSGLTVSEARDGLEAVKNQFEQAEMDGQSCWFAPSSKETHPAGRAYLLSIYDEYISGYKDRSAMVDTAVGDKLIALGNALTNIIIVDGQVVGNWRRTFGKGTVGIETNNYRQLTPAEWQAVTASAQQYGDFLGLTVELT